MSRLRALLNKPGEKLVPFLTAGFPTLELTRPLVLAAEKAGADMVELGMPFSDPLAEGPVIQASSQIALENGVTLHWILEQVRTIRKFSDIPLVLMGYINPILQYGMAPFIQDAQEAGVDGFIIPDLPPEESAKWVQQCRKADVSPILLVAPNTPNRRINTISQLAGDLIYAVSVLGITGSDLQSNRALVDYLKRVRKYSTTPFIVGFGVRTRKDVVTINRVADGSVVGTALIERIRDSRDPVKVLEHYIRNLKGQ